MYIAYLYSLLHSQVGSQGPLITLVRIIGFELIRRNLDLIFSGTNFIISVRLDQVCDNLKECSVIVRVSVVLKRTVGEGARVPC